MTPFLLALAALAAARVQGPLAVKVGNPLRKVLLDTLRPIVEKDFGQKVKFQVDTLNAKGEWAFYGGTALRPDGKPIDLKTTRYRKDAEFMDGPMVYALLKKKDGRWRVVKYIVGPTDVAYVDWPSQTGAPAIVLGLKEVK